MGCNCLAQGGVVVTSSASAEELQSRITIMRQQPADKRHIRLECQALKQD
jgi:hypothetical protein